MKPSRDWRSLLFGDIGVLVWLAVALIALHTVTNNQYGFHRDELNFLDDGRHLAWGYVDCPPLTPFIARIALELFGASMVGIRLFPALSQGLVLVLAGLIVRELGGSRWAQVTAAIAAAISPVALSQGNLFMYVAFDILWWVLAAYFMVRLLKSEDPRWWLGIGAAIGLGMMTKYTMGFLVVGIVAGILFTTARRYLKSPWLWAGVALSLFIFLPNLVWLVQHDFITLDKLSFVHARDLRAGNTRSYLTEQLYLSVNIAALVLWINGLRFYWLSSEGQKYRPVGWMFVVPFILFLVARGRGYYMTPAYPMLIAAGAYLAGKRRSTLAAGGRRVQAVQLYTGLAIGGLLSWAVAVPVAPLNSTWWKLADRMNQNFREEIGWPELVQTVAGIRDTLPPEEQSRLGILASNYGEAGAVNLYGPAYGLPEAISGIDSYWLWGYGDPPPETLIVIGFDHRYAYSLFESCTLAGLTPNPYGIENEETLNHPEILLCRTLRRPWPEFWASFQYFG